MTNDNAQAKENPMTVLEEVDEAIERERFAGAHARAAADQSEERVSGLTRVLRVLGGAALLVSAVIFMFQNWNGVDHLLRYYYFLGFTVLLGAVGLFSGLKLNDDKGARTFLALAACMVSVNCMQLGGLMYSVLPRLGSTPVYPRHFHWVAPSLGSAAFTAILALGVLSIVVFTAFSALVRKKAGVTAAVFMGSNAALLLPVRDPDVTGLLIFVLTLGLAMIDDRQFQREAVMRTREGVFVRLSCFLPVLLIIVRALDLYPVSRLFISANFGALALLLYAMLPGYFKSENCSHLLMRSAAFPTIVSYLMLSAELCSKLDVPELYVIPARTLPLAVILLAMGLRARPVGGLYRVLSVAAASFGLVLQLEFHPDSFSAFLCIVTSVVMIITSQVSGRKEGFVAGITGFIYGCLFYVRFAIFNYGLSPWLILAMFGAALVLGSSYLEREFKRISAILKKF
ncbi:MAG: hypothetical protein K1X83_06210 [Oligoflexia bacterium]|nr:hypothetical protein [Oligoflexia bacterium]